MSTVILVDENDVEVGLSEKMEAHQLGLLHRAFSIFIFNSKNELLIHQRAADKYHSGGLWTNTCCSHPLPGVSLEDSAKKRLMEEMGLSVDELTVKNYFVYRAEFPNGLIEHELDYILFGYSDIDPVLNKNEAQNFKWISLDQLKSDVKKHPEKYTYWLKEIFNRDLV